MEIWAAAGAILGVSATAAGVAAGVGATVAIAGTAYSTIEAKRGADAAGRTSTAVGNYNARVDMAEAAQIDLDTRANIAAMRKDAAVYMSRQNASFVGAGVRSNTGSALAVQVATAGQLALRQQQLFADSEAKQRKLGSSAAAGIAEGEAQSDAYHMEGIAAVANGAARVASTIGSAYAGGAFGGGGSVGTGTTNLSAGLNSGPAAGATDLPSINAGGYV